MSTTAVTYIGGPTVLLEWAGLRIVTDPTFDPPQSYPERGSTTLVKTAGPGILRTDLGRVDLVLLSHHTHKDNLDWEGLELIAQGPTTISTREAASDLWGGSVQGLDDWESTTVGGATVTVVPALHVPPGYGYDPPVVGFVLQSPDAPTVYVSGDNSSLGLVEQIADNFPDIQLAILFAGAARVPEIDADLTLGSAEAAEAARLLGPRAVVGVHTADWAHFSQTREQLEAAFASTPGLLIDTPKGLRVEL
ncbi:MAG: MBL fold metallo-hydrolase [Micrococcales bacterium]|nr:MBL fold metallo-hydrolase [Micrococcales bacterium]